MGFFLLHEAGSLREQHRGRPAQPCFLDAEPLILKRPSDPGLASQARGMELVVCVIVCSLPSPNPTSRPSELSTKGFKAGNDRFA